MFIAKFIVCPTLIFGTQVLKTIMLIRMSADKCHWRYKRRRFGVSDVCACLCRNLGWLHLTRRGHVVSTGFEI